MCLNPPCYEPVGITDRPNRPSYEELLDELERLQRRNRDLEEQNQALKVLLKSELRVY